MDDLERHAPENLWTAYRSGTRYFFDDPSQLYPEEVLTDCIFGHIFTASQDQLSFELAQHLTKNPHLPDLHEKAIATTNQLEAAVSQLQTGPLPPYTFDDIRDSLREGKRTRLDALAAQATRLATLHRGLLYANGITTITVGDHERHEKGVTQELLAPFAGVVIAHDTQGKGPYLEALVKGKDESIRAFPFAHTAVHLCMKEVPATLDTTRVQE